LLSQYGAGMFYEVTISPEKIILQRKRALRYIHPRAPYVGFTVRVGAKS